MRVHATVTINIVYDDAESLQEAEDYLNYTVRAITNSGILTGDCPMTVDTWDSKVEVKKEPR